MRFCAREFRIARLDYVIYVIVFAIANHCSCSVTSQNQFSTQLMWKTPWKLWTSLSYLWSPDSKSQSCSSEISTTEVSEKETSLEKLTVKRVFYGI